MYRPRAVGKQLLRFLRAFARGSRRGARSGGASACDHLTTGSSPQARVSSRAVDAGLRDRARSSVLLVAIRRAATVCHIRQIRQRIAGKSTEQHIEFVHAWMQPSAVAHGNDSSKMLHASPASRAQDEITQASVEVSLPRHCVRSASQHPALGSKISGQPIRHALDRCVVIAGHDSDS
jgi:hypothetical protein